MATPNVRVPPPVVRCAIYTRKSTEEGLEQEFNSLDAQREAAEAYILSQKAEGWCALPQRYDDGGFSGGNIDRPALAKLLADVEAGLLDSVVVYKVDRLSRSLLDFARILGIFEKHHISFVSVTQQFNTSVPVGRLTLNILFSFAQFEREIISERTRDKKAAARRKGKWTGGFIPLGYDLEPRGGALVINEQEAERVRSIYRLFAEGSLEETLVALQERGWTTKGWTTASGRQRPGTIFREASLLRLLRSELYVGVVRYQGQLYAGEQPAIVDKRLWNSVQTKLRRFPPQRVRKERNKQGALLKGLLRCGKCGKAMHATFTKSGERRYRYYVCGSGSVCSNRVAAATIEQSVVGKLQDAGGNRTELQKLVAIYNPGEAVSAPEVIATLGRMIEFATYDAQSREIVIRLKRGKSHSA